MIGDVISITRDKMRARKALPKRAWAIVNATASLTAREAFGSIPDGIEIPRVIETVLFAAGRLGVVTVEGPRRNPDTLDLMQRRIALRASRNHWERRCLPRVRGSHVN